MHLTVEECLRRIDERDGDIRAWAHVNREARGGSGPLAGVCIGVKDIFDTFDLPTEYGSEIYRGRRPGRDAGLVARLRKLGGVMLGKTHTAAFAYFDPAPTRNPRDLQRTPGGSSSGSAAAVAAGMVPYALGTQTQGSVIRPAAYCGVVGFKPTYGLLSLEGVLPFAPSLDTAGLFAPTARDLCRLWEGMGFNTAAHAAEVQEAEYPEGFDQVLPAVKLVNDYEGARTHERRWREHGDRIGRKLAALVAAGLEIPESDYRRALRTLANMRSEMTHVYRQHPVLTSPAATGPAPLGLESTGDPRMNAPWTGLYGPAITVPLPGKIPPEGLQLTAAPGEDGLLLTTAAALEESRLS